MQNSVILNAILLSSALTVPALAQDQTGQLSSALSPGCGPYDQSCSTDKFTSTTTDNTAPVSTVISPGTTITQVDQSTVFSGVMNLNGIPTINYSSSTSQILIPATIYGGDIVFAEISNASSIIDITANGSYDTVGNLQTKSSLFFGAQTSAENSLIYNNQQIDVTSLSIDLQENLTLKSGDYIQYGLKSSEYVGGNSVGLSGSFQTDNGDGRNPRISFGTVTGVASVLVNNEPFIKANLEAVSPYKLDMDLNFAVTTALDENGLTTPTIAVSNGINMNGSKITNLAAGTSSGDAVNYDQFSALATSLSGLTSSTTNMTFGSGSAASGLGAVALGYQQVATGNGAVALGDPNTATGNGAVAIGADNSALGDGAVAIGRDNVASGKGSIALGNDALANQAGAVAFGDGASATGAGSVALGSGSVATVANTVSVGAPGRARGIVNVANGAVARGSTDAVNGGQLYENRNESRHGVAAAMAMVSAPMPSGPGRTAWAFNLATYKGAKATAFSLTHRLNTESPFAISSAVSYTSDAAGVRVGLSGEF